MFITTNPCLDALSESGDPTFSKSQLQSSRTSYMQFSSCSMILACSLATENGCIQSGLVAGWVRRENRARQVRHSTRHQRTRNGKGRSRTRSVTLASICTISIVWQHCHHPSQLKRELPQNSCCRSIWRSSRANGRVVSKLQQRSGAF